MSKENKMYHVVEVDEGIIDGNDFDGVLLDGGAQHQTTDATKSKKENDISYISLLLILNNQ